MSKKVTDWYPPEIKPVRVGVYDISRDYFPPWFAHWNGKEWDGVGVTPQKSIEPEAPFWEAFGIRQDFAWRGLASKP